MANIAQISSLTGRAAGLLTDMIVAAPVLEVVEFQPEASDHLLATGREAASGSSARNEGEAALRTAVAPTVSPRKLRIYRREVAVDDLRRMDVSAGRTTAQGLLDFYDSQLRVEANGMAEEFQSELFNGTDTTNEAGKNLMLGFSEFVKDGAAAAQTSRFGFGAAEIAAMNVQASLTIDTVENQNAFVELLMRVLADVPGANAIHCNTRLFARITMIGKRLGAAGESVTSYGTKVPTFNNVKIIPVPETAISQTESDGDNADCSSLYIARYGENTGCAVTTNSGFAFTDFLTTSELAAGIARIQMFVNLAIQKRNALRRISRIRL